MSSQVTDVDWLFAPAQVIDEHAVDAARTHQAQLTKPPGSLGRLEGLALQFAGWQGVTKPQLNNICVRIYAADHGVCNHGVSAFPQAVTAQMIANFSRGGAAITVLSRMLKADFAVVNLGTVVPLPPMPAVYDRSVGLGTKDFSAQAAMTCEQLEQALTVGRDHASSQDYQLFVGGEMGIGNTTSASALLSALLQLAPEVTVGPGTGVDEEGLRIKRGVIAAALDCHSSHLSHPLECLRRLGGFEIVALVASFITCAQRGVPVLVDGFIATAAAVVAIKLNPSVESWMLLGHHSAEPGHQLALECFTASPLLDLGMGLGEGSGAATAVPIIQAALTLHREMATFEQAGVSASEPV